MLPHTLTFETNNIAVINFTITTKDSNEVFINAIETMIGDYKYIETRYKNFIETSYEIKIIDNDETGKNIREYREKIFEFIDCLYDIDNFTEDDDELDGFKIGSDIFISKFFYSMALSFEIEGLDIKLERGRDSFMTNNEKVLPLTERVIPEEVSSVITEPEEVIRTKDFIDNYSELPSESVLSLDIPDMGDAKWLRDTDLEVKENKEKYIDVNNNNSLNEKLRNHFNQMFEYSDNGEWLRYKNNGEHFSIKDKDIAHISCSDVLNPYLQDNIFNEYVEFLSENDLPEPYRIVFDDLKGWVSEVRIMELKNYVLIIEQQCSPLFH